jgi:AcrR family transcriptional regulator
MNKRSHILEAAASLFGEHGYRGTTTRRIAFDAGVSEVTLFRIFGTKEELLREALAGVAAPKATVRALPSEPADPERELVQWCAAYLRQLQRARSILRKSMGELAQRPSIVAQTAAVPADASRVLREYLKRASRSRLLPAGFDVMTAATLLAGVLFADALSRDLLPDEFPGPETQAPRRYVRLVLDGIHHIKCPIRRHPPPPPASRPAGKRARTPEKRSQTSVDRRRTGVATPPAT